MLDKIFDINNFNIFSDEENYYFFRALNMGDNNDIDNAITLDSDGTISRIRTDRERYEDVPLYDENSEISLMEMFNHIKMHHRTDTNCISLTSNANAAVLYGRGYYKDKYVMIKVPKKEFGTKVYNAGLYMMNEINSIITKMIENNELDESTKYFLTLIENAPNEGKLKEIVELLKLNKEDKKDEMFEKGITYQKSNITSVDYPALTPRQNFEKNKMIAKINVINKNILPNVANKFLVQTVGNAFSSLELINYKDIQKDNIVSVPKEIIDILALLQQVPEDIPRIEELKKEFVGIIVKDECISQEFKYKDRELNNEKEYTIENMYELTDGSVDFDSAISLYKKSFYLSKSKLRTISSVNLLATMVENTKYKEVLDYLKDKTYGVEPEVFSRHSSNRMKISESVNLDFRSNERELFEYIDGLSYSDLNNIIDNPKEALKYYINNFKSVEHIQVDKDTYYANAIVDLFDWSKLGIVDISLRQRDQIINKLKENNVVEVYNILKNSNVKERDIANVLLTTIIKEKEIDDIDFKDTFTREELEDFLGYYKINGTKGLKLRSYQATALTNIDKIFEEKQFATAILPTGAGKSFVALAEMLEHSDEDILYLAPNDEILNQIEKYILEIVCDESLEKSDSEKIKEKFKHLKLCTYQSLLADKRSKVLDGVDKDIVNHKYGLIVFDELHRSGAAEWKNSVLDLLDNQDENTKVLGITATPIRDMDGVNMADDWAKYFDYSKEEIFGRKHIAMNMDLEEAIRLGYVIHPKIVQCEYNLEKDGSLERLRQQIESIEDETLRKKELVKFEALRRRVLEADNIEKVIGDNLKQGGKYIIFCPVLNSDGNMIETEDGFLENYKINGKEVIEKYQKEMVLNIIKYRGITDIVLNENDPIERYMEVANQLGLQFNSLLGSYSKTKNRNELRKFEKDDPDKIKFITVINKLSEGTHVEGVTGIIWLRPLGENSKILYLQHFGRVVFSVDPNKEVADEDRTIVIDIVNNTFRVNLDKVGKYKTSDLDWLIIISGWMDQHDNMTPDLNSDDKIEASYGTQLKRIQEKYSQYLNDLDSIEDKKEKEKEEIKKILNVGSDINLWTQSFPEKKKKGKGKGTGASENDIDFDNFEITGILKDYYDLSEEVEKLSLSPLQYVKKIQEYCGTYNEWPKQRAMESKLSDGTTGKKLYKWLWESGYINGDFKYNNVVDEEGQTIKKILDELYKNIFNKEKLEMVERVKKYCEKYGWPKFRALENKLSDGTTGHDLYKWLWKSGYINGDFKYNNVVDEEGQTIKEILDELYRKHITDASNNEIIEMVKRIKEYCEDKKEWPKSKKIEDKTSDGTTSGMLYHWLYVSGYIKGEFKYSDVVDETGRPIKEILDELYKKYVTDASNNEKIEIVKRIKEYCEDKKEWPKQFKNTSKVPWAKTSRELYHWLYVSGYINGDFKYNNVVDETGRPIKEILDELYKKYVTDASNNEIIEMVKQIQEYCEDKRKWPNTNDRENKTLEGKTASQLYTWLLSSGYTKGDFKYIDIVDETGRPIKEILDELYKKYVTDAFNNEKIEMVKRIREYCEDKKEWPKRFSNKSKVPWAKASRQLCDWLYISGYTKGEFKYIDVVDETGRPIKEVLDELYEKYAKKNREVIKESFDEVSKFKEVSNKKKENNDEKGIR